MALAKAWRELDRSTVGAAPERYGYYELGDGDGTIVGRGHGVLRDELKEALGYGTVPERRSGTRRTASGPARQVRWAVAEHREHAARLFEEHAEN